MLTTKKNHGMKSSVVGDSMTERGEVVSSLRFYQSAAQVIRDGKL